MNRIALITGATAGIGRDVAIAFAKNNIDLIISGRRTQRLEELKSHLASEFSAKVIILKMDVSNRNDVEESFRYLPEEWKNIDILINNAGLAVGLDPLQEGLIDDWERMIDTNVKGLLYVTRTIVPGMILRNTGHIINIGSMAGKEVYPGGNVYCATKHAVDALTKAMRIDLLGKNIKVSQICPGLTETEFSNVRFKGDEQKAEKVYQGYTPLYGEDIAAIATFLVNQPPHVCINDVVVSTIHQANSYLVDKKT
jgi:3-hydroxy acid dehydrogenase / malonic semialdehyde reductase